MSSAPAPASYFSVVYALLNRKGMQIKLDLRYPTCTLILQERAKTIKVPDRRSGRPRTVVADDYIAGEDIDFVMCEYADGTPFSERRGMVVFMRDGCMHVQFVDSGSQQNRTYVLTAEDLANFKAISAVLDQLRSKSPYAEWGETRPVSAQAGQSKVLASKPEPISSVARGS